ncbi:MAG TPA: serine/threonine-protein kinase [Xanthomonadaceae bacterium]|nr:serine/threonine-protein kinase [Xanthomonadaceae bacterium]
MKESGAGALTGTRAGPWLLLEPIAEGGMGAVYRARRDDGAFEQYSAIKLIRPELLGGDDELRTEMLRRFHEERRILARLDHPGIARILDGGSTASGVPWLAMELVDGQPLLHYVNDQGLGMAARVRLFIGICEAVQAAHRSLVVHRDIKPANLLVDRTGQVKLVDFGIAKELVGGGEHTRTGWSAMTPDYAAPEQVQGEPITTATDVYALGVVLYELLTGERPYRLAGASPAEIVRQVCSTDPERPSRVGRMSGAFVAWRQGLRGDLDHIVLKAMRKDPAARYAAAAELGADLRRHLDGLPVQARGDALGYRVRTFLRRNALAVTVAMGVFVALALATVIALRQAADARLQAERAQVEATRAEQVMSFLQRMLMEADPFESGVDVSIADAMRSAARRIATEFPDQPAAEAAVRRSIGRAFMGRGLDDEAEPHLRQAFLLKRRVYGEDDPRTLLAGGDLAWLAHERGDSDTAIEVYRPLLARFPRNVDSLREHTLRSDFAVVLNSAGHHAEAERLLRGIVEALDRGQSSIDEATALGNLASALHGLERHGEAADYYRRALAAGGVEDANRSVIANNFAVLLDDIGDAQGAYEQVRNAVEIRRRTLGNEHPGMVLPLINLSASARNFEGDEAADSLLREALAVAESRLDPGHPHRLLTRLLLGRSALQQDGDPLPLEALLDDLERLPERRMPMEMPVLQWLAEHAEASGERARARALAAEAMRRGSARLGADHALVVEARALADTLGVGD